MNNKTNYKHQPLKEAKGLNLKNSMPYCVKHVLHDVVFLALAKKNLKNYKI